MAELDGLIDMIPIGDIAKKLGINEKEATSAVKAALPTIVAGLTANAGNAEGAAKLEKTLEKHTDKKSTSLDDIDEEDGKKIVNHVFGSKKEAVAEAAAAKSDVTKDIIAKILPIVAPIVLAWLAQKFLGGGATEKAEPKAAPTESSGGIGDILGGLASSKEGQDILGGILGGLLGGKK